MHDDELIRVKKANEAHGTGRNHNETNLNPYVSV